MTTEETTNGALPNHESDQSQPELTLTAYDVKRKMKNVPILDGVITKTAKGAYMCKGVSSEGTKLTTLMNEAKAIACVEAGLAKQGW